MDYELFSNLRMWPLIWAKLRYLRVPSFWKLYLETALYSILLAGFAGWLLF
jgi:hypothetical protein